MSDHGTDAPPIETDTMRSAYKGMPGGRAVDRLCDEIDRLRAELQEARREGYRLTSLDLESCITEVDRLRAENAALAAALEDIAGITYSPAHNAYVAGECSRFDGHECYIADPDDPGVWCPVCVAEVCWSAWKLGVLR